MKSTIRELEVFLVVARRRSFSAAARELGTSRSAVSKAIARLEGHTGTTLFRRTTRSMALTPAGEHLAVEVREPLERLQAVQAELGQDQALRGRVRIAAPLAYGHRRVAPAIHSFVAAHAEVEIDVAYDDRLADLSAEGVDLAIRGGHLPDSSLIARRLAPITVNLAATPSYLANHPAIRTPADLHAHRILGHTRDPLLLQRGDTRVQLRPNYTIVTRSGDARIAGARAGLGLALLLRFMVPDDFNTVLTDWRIGGEKQQAFYLLRPAGRPSSLVRALADHLVEQLTDSVP